MNPVESFQASTDGFRVIEDQVLGNLGEDTM